MIAIPMFSRFTKQINCTFVSFQSGEQIAKNVEVSLACILLHDARFLEQVFSNCG